MKICVLLNLMAATQFAWSTPSVLVPAFGSDHHAAAAAAAFGNQSESIVVPTNQGRFATPRMRAAFIETRMTADAMLQKTGGRDPAATLEKAWVKGKRDHFTLLLQFTDGNCEQMEWMPLGERTTRTLGEHPAGEARLHPKPKRGAQCTDAASFVDMTDAKVPFSALVTLRRTKQKVDVAKWAAKDQQINRRQMYSAFLEETRGYKDEEKYSCPTFVNNVFGRATGQSFIPASKMVSLLKMAATFIHTPDRSGPATAQWSDIDECCHYDPKNHGKERKGNVWCWNDDECGGSSADWTPSICYDACRGDGRYHTIRKAAGFWD